MVDILLDENGDLLIQNNDLKIGFCDNQNMTDIIQTVPGEYKLYPEVGCDIWRFLKGNSTDAEAKNVVKKQLELQGFTVFDVIVNREEGDINIEPYAERS